MVRFAALSTAGCVATVLAYHWHAQSQSGFSAHRLAGLPPHAPARAPKTCVVVGAGLEGITTAYYLRQSGWEVTVVDAADGPGQCTSYANAGLICRTSARPIASPANLQRVVHSYLSGTMVMDARQLPGMLRWCAFFLRNCLPDRFRANTTALAAFATRSQEHIGKLVDTLGLECDLRKSGLLVVYRDESMLAAASQTARDVEPQIGGGPVELPAPRCLEIEPALRGSKIVGGLHHALEWFGDARAFTRGVAAACERDGVRFRYNTPVLTVLTDGEQVSGVLTEAGEAIYAEHVVLAAACRTAALARQVGVYAPIVPIKGYSVTLPMPPALSGARPTTCVIDSAADSHVYLTPLGARLRVAGMVEVTGFDSAINEDTVAHLRHIACALYPDVAKANGWEKLSLREMDAWCGLRPVTPDGLPIVSATHIRGLWINAGHGTLGWTLCAGTAHALVAMLEGGPAHPALDIRRFTARGLL